MMTKNKENLKAPAKKKDGLATRIVAIALVALVVYGWYSSQHTAETERLAQPTKAETERLRSEYLAKKNDILADLDKLLLSKKWDEVVHKSDPYKGLGEQELLSRHNKGMEMQLLEKANANPNSILDNTAIYAELTRLNPSEPSYQKKLDYYQSKRDEWLAQYDKRQEMQLVEKAKAIPADKLSENIAIYTELARLNPSDLSYQKKRDYYQSKLNQKNEKVRKQGADFEKKYGSSPTRGDVRLYLKGVLRDPESLVLDNCSETYHSNDGWIILCDYRAKNGFGGMNRETKWFIARGGQVVGVRDGNYYTINKN